MIKEPEIPSGLEIGWGVITFCTPDIQRNEHGSLEANDAV
jgi:hypothetical protein